MEPPFDGFVVISLGSGQSSGLFTMEGNLTNSNGIDVSEPIALPEGATDEEKAEAAAAAKQRAIAETAPDAQKKTRESYEAVRVEFRRRLANLERPMPDLRWYTNYGTDPQNPLPTYQLATP